jgi:hypothetical protein
MKIGKRVSFLDQETQMRSTFLCLALAAASAAMGQIPSSVSNFIPVPGVREFSGRLIARPTQLMTLVNQQGLTPAAAYQANETTRRALVRYTVQYVPETDEYILRVPKDSTEGALAYLLNTQGRFQYIEPDWIVFPTTIPNDPSIGSQWHLAKIDAFNAWSLFTAQSTPIIVAVTDTGVQVDHEDLIDRFVPGANCATGTPIPQSSGGQVSDVNGHGSHTSGIAAATCNNAKGGCGMGWGLKLMPIRVSDVSTGGASTAALTAGARWAADNGARVVSTSYSGVSASTVGTNGTYLRSKNCLYFYAAGNDGANLSTFDWPDVNVIGASDSNDLKASFSAFGTAIDVFAPGVGIYSTYKGGPSSYATLSGTSMATPCAAGVATVITASNPSMTSFDVETSLYQGCDNIGAAATFGWGRVNLNKSLRYAYNNFPFPTIAATAGQGSLGSDPLSAMNVSDNAYYGVNSNQWVSVTLRFHSTLLQVGSMQLNLEDAASAQGGTICSVTSGAGGGGQKLDISSVGVNDNARVINVPNSAIDAGTGDVIITLTYMPFSRTIPAWQAKIDRAVLFTRP